jgi:hypothetical protein
VLYLIIGKTHPEVVKNDGEVYREFLQKKVKELKIKKRFSSINTFIRGSLEYLQRTDLYFLLQRSAASSKWYFVYALSAGCPVISTPIPHSLEF